MRRSAGTDGASLLPRGEGVGRSPTDEGFRRRAWEPFATRRKRTERAHLIALSAEPSSGPSGHLLPEGEGVRGSADTRRRRRCAAIASDPGVRMTFVSDDSIAVARAGWSYIRKRQMFLAAMAAPALLYVLAVAVGPMVQGFLYSFDNYSLIRPGSRHFVGLDNYLALWRDPTARRALLNTFAFTFGAVTLEFVLGLGVALLLWRDDWFNRVALGLLLIPATVTPLVVGLLFKALLSPEYGMLGYPLGRTGPQRSARAACRPAARARHFGRDRRLGMDAADGAHPARGAQKRCRPTFSKPPRSMARTGRSDSGSSSCRLCCPRPFSR